MTRHSIAGYLPAYPLLPYSKQTANLADNLMDAGLETWTAGFQLQLDIGNIVRKGDESTEIHTLGARNPESVDERRDLWPVSGDCSMFSVIPSMSVTSILVNLNEVYLFLPGLQIVLKRTLMFTASVGHMKVRAENLSSPAISNNQHNTNDTG